MKATIYRPSGDILPAYIDYFLLLKNEEGNGSYKTFPNINLCLALYKGNNIRWDRQTNQCAVLPSSTPGNQLFGFHKKPFSVSYSGKVEQVCILFKPGGMSSFSAVPVNRIDPVDDPWTQLFGPGNNFLVERLFSLETGEEQVALLETFLLKRINTVPERSAPAMRALQLMQQPMWDEKTVVRHLGDTLSVDTSTLYRKCMIVFGQPPLEIYRTIRFRRTLSGLLAGKQSFTKTAYENNFFDQSHLIRDITQFTGETPGRLLKDISSVRETLHWVKN